MKKIMEGKEESSTAYAEKSSPPFEKGRTGGISGKAFSKRESLTEKTKNVWKLTGRRRDHQRGLIFS